MFLKTGNRFKGILWKRHHNDNDYYSVREDSLGDFKAEKYSEKLLYCINSINIPDFNKVTVIRVSFENDFVKQNNSTLILTIKGVDNHYLYFKDNRYLLHFSENDLNTWQKGFFDFEIPPFEDTNMKLVELEIFSKNQANDLKKMKISFLSPELCRK